MVLIVVGVSRIASLGLSRPGPMIFVVVVSVISSLGALLDHVIFPPNPVLNAARQILSLAELAAILVFCSVMKSICLRAGLLNAGSSWSTTIKLFLVIYVVPLGLLHGVGLVMRVTGGEFKFDLGAAGLLFLPVFFAPLVHFFISTSRMRREASAAASAA